ncbi:MAG TPA: Tat pathway signal sequence domain protein [Candidatus Angelobacter sp.]
MTNEKLSRRQLAKLSVGALTMSTLTALPGSGLVPALSADQAPGNDSQFLNSANLKDGLAKAYSFLEQMMDAYAQGQTLRLIQSYSDQMGLLSTSFVYDNSVVINALLLRGGANLTQRALVLGETLLYAQQHDPIGDGRVRQAYFVNQPDANGVFLQEALAPFFFIGSATGDMSWTGMALAHLFARSGNRQFLDGAVRLGQWIVNNTFSSSGPGGFIGGVDNNNNPVTFKSTEHNIDAFALFTMLAELTGNSFWSGQAQHARTFIEALFNTTDGFFWTGTLPDGVTINTNPIPEDVNTWSFLALQDKDFAGSVDWAKTNLAVTDTPQNVNTSVAGNKVRISGVNFSNFAQHPPIVNNNFAPSDPFSTPPDPGAVWLEGTAHLAAALIARRLPAERDLPGFSGDQDTARFLLMNILGAQATQGIGQTVAGNVISPGTGVVAASSELNNGFGFSNKPNPHTGATGWFAIAGQAGNPFRLG